MGIGAQCSTELKGGEYAIGRESPRVISGRAPQGWPVLVAHSPRMVAVMVHTPSNRNVVGTGPDASRNGSYQVNAGRGAWRRTPTREVNTRTIGAAVNSVVASPGFTLANQSYSAANGWLLSTRPQVVEYSQLHSFRIRIALLIKNLGLIFYIAGAVERKLRC